MPTNRLGISYQAIQFIQCFWCKANFIYINLKPERARLISDIEPFRKRGGKTHIFDHSPHGCARTLPAMKPVGLLD
ncbi:Uncharacterised protein [Klebsiella pneumoniae]|nr:Uncharacterised protein [Klebsiella pneumoniae]SAW30497.1 Uncharacterised protein [Klebsiella pneumoniae]SSI44115.1 Uncharacterised protein [Klebsiella pneumoniae]